MKTTKEKLNEIDLKNKVDYTVSKDFSERYNKNTQALYLNLKNLEFNVSLDELTNEINLKTSDSTAFAFMSSAANILIGDLNGVNVLDVGITTERGLDEDDMREIAEFLKRLLSMKEYVREIQIDVEMLVCHFPMHNTCLE